VLRTFGKPYEVVVNSSVDYLGYLNVLQRDGMNLVRVFGLGFYEGTPATARYLHPWLRKPASGTALDGLGKWDLAAWDETYFTRFNAFVQACSDRGIVVQLSLFCTFYDDVQWRGSPFHPANNLQGFGPNNRFDCLRPVDANLLAAQQAAVRRIVSDLNRFDNIYYEIQNEPYWNEPGVKDAQEVDFHNRMLETIRSAELGLPSRHLVAHNFPQQSAAMSSDFDAINEHYPAAVEGTPIAGAEALLRDQYSSGKVLALDETDNTSTLQTRLECWMFLLGGGGIYDGLDAHQSVYTATDPAGDNALGSAYRGVLRNSATYAANLNLVALRRNAAWLTGGLPADATLQAMATPGEQYVAYWHHGKSSGTFQLSYNIIDGASFTVAPVVALPEGTWQAVWTRPADLAVLRTEDFTHAGGTRTLVPVTYQQDVALRIDRTGTGHTTPPPFPTGLLASSNADDSITLSWHPVTASDLASYQVYRAEASPVPLDSAHRIAVRPADITSHVDTATVVNTTYFYVVTALDLSGNESAASCEVSARSGIGPTANAGPDQQVVDQDDNGVEAVTLDASASVAGASPILSYAWLSNGAPLASGMLATVTLAAGQYPIELVVTDGNGLQNVDEMVATVITEGLVNGSFEAGFQGWVSAGNQVIEAAPPYTASNGSQLVAFNAGELEPNGILAQTFTTIPGQTYALTFDAAVLAFNTQSQSLQITVAGTGILLTQTLTIDGLGGGTLRWLPQIFTFVANNSTTTLTFTDQSATTNDIDLLLDNVRVTRITTSPNTAPVAVADGFATFQDAPLLVPAPGVLDNDSDAEFNPLTAVVNTAPSHGTLTLVADGGFTYTPAAGFTGADSFTYHANDGSLDSSIVSVDITVNAVVTGILANPSFESNFTAWTTSGNLSLQSAAPYAATDGTSLVAFNDGQAPSNGVLTQAFATAPGQTYILNFDVGVLAYNTNSQQMQVTVTGTGSLLDQSITVTGLGGGRTRWVAQTFNFVANSALTMLTFRDKSTSTTNLDLLLDNVRVTNLASIPNTAPVAVADAYSTFQDVALVIPAAGVLANDTDAEANPLTAVLDVGPSHGSLSLNAAGGFTYTPSAGYTGADAFTYHANDGGLDSNIASVALTINPVVTGVLANGSFESNYAGWTPSGNQSITATNATDGIKLVTFNAGQTKPNGVLAQAFPTTPGQTYTLTFDAGVLAFNTNSQVLQVSVTGSGTLLARTITLTGSGGGATRWVPQSFTFVSNSTTTTLTFRDQSTTTNSIDLLLDNVRVTAPVSVPNTAPVAMADSYAATKDVALVVAAVGVLANDTDAQANPLTAVLDAGPVHGSLTLNANGGFTYTPTAGYTGGDSFTYHASDGSLNSNIATVDLSVNGIIPGTVVNGSFEANFTGWTASGNVFVELAAPDTAPDGAKLVTFNGGQSTPNGVLSQAFATAAGQRYTLAFDVGVLSYNTNSQTLALSVTGSGSLLSRTITLFGVGAGPIRWTPQSFAFVANSTTTTLTFRDQSATTKNIDLMIDNVRVTAVATTPLSAATSALAGAATAAMSTGGALAPTPSLAGTPDAFIIRMSATQAGSYVLERSPDLKTWERVSEMQVTGPGLIEFHDAPGFAGSGPPPPAMFYRIGLQPEPAAR
jgi:hypothetical protein